MCLCKAAMVKMSCACCSRTRQAPLNTLFYTKNCCVWGQLLWRLFKKSVFCNSFFHFAHFFLMENFLLLWLSVFWSTAYPKRSKFWCSHFLITLSSQSPYISPTVAVFPVSYETYCLYCLTLKSSLEILQSLCCT